LFVRLVRSFVLVRRSLLLVSLVRLRGKQSASERGGEDAAFDAGFRPRRRSLEVVPPAAWADAASTVEGRAPGGVETAADGAVNGDAAALRAAVAHRLVAAAEALARAPIDEERAVHDARRACKQARALLRLGRPVFGEAGEALRRQVRDLGRLLGPLRDDAVMRATLRRVAPESAALLAAQAIEIAPLVGPTCAHGRSDDETAATLTTATQIARFLAQGANALPLGDGDVDAKLRRGLRDVLRRARRGWREARDETSATRLHEWRKTVKDCQFVADALGNGWVRAGLPPGRELARLGHRLGLLQDLAVLRRELRLVARTAPPAVRAACENARRAASAELRVGLRKALRAGKATLGRGRLVPSKAQLVEAWRTARTSMRGRDDGAMPRQAADASAAAPPAKAAKARESAASSTKAAKARLTRELAAPSDTELEAAADALRDVETVVGVRAASQAATVARRARSMQTPPTASAPRARPAAKAAARTKRRTKTGGSTRGAPAS
jgi:CHAD domain-containing protein